MNRTQGLHLAGERSAGGAGTASTHDPSTGAVIAQVAQADAADADRAVSTAHEAHRRHWRDTPARHRGEVLRAVAELVAESDPTWARAGRIDATVDRGLDGVDLMVALGVDAA